MRNIGDMVGKNKIIGAYKVKKVYKYSVICMECGAKGERWYNYLKNCRFCKPRNRKLIDKGKYYELELTGGEYTKIDKEDYEKIRNHCWYKSIKGSVESRINNKLIKLHRLVTKAPKGLIVDHIKGNTLDNRKSKLRICTNSDNSKNQNKVRGKNKYKGVSWSNYKGCFVGRITSNGKSYSADFKKDIDAAIWYDELALELHGNFARTNKDLGLL